MAVSWANKRLAVLRCADSLHVSSKWVLCYIHNVTRVGACPSLTQDHDILICIVLDAYYKEYSIGSTVAIRVPGSS